MAKKDGQVLHVIHTK
ncbi:TPA: hypothetical protein ACHLBA_005653 [Escherichia coli]|nr:hypothetical protein [Escherichia coli]